MSPRLMITKKVFKAKEEGYPSLRWSGEERGEGEQGKNCVILNVMPAPTGVTASDVGENFKRVTTVFVRGWENRGGERSQRDGITLLLGRERKSGL